MDPEDPTLEPMPLRCAAPVLPARRLFCDGVTEPEENLIADLRETLDYNRDAEALPRERQVTRCNPNGSRLRFTFMIIGFRHRGLRRLYETGDRRRLPVDNVPRIQEILTLLDAAARAGEMAQPGYRLHPLSGSFTGFWSVTVNRNWRIIFRFEDSNVTDVDLVDYH